MRKSEKRPAGKSAYRYFCKAHRLAFRDHTDSSQIKITRIDGREVNRLHHGIVADVGEFTRLDHMDVLSVGTGHGQFIMGNQPFVRLTLIGQEVERRDETFTAQVDGQQTAVDKAGSLLITVGCCGSLLRLHIRKSERKAMHPGSRNRVKEFVGIFTSVIYSNVVDAQRAARIGNANTDAVGYNGRETKETLVADGGSLFVQDNRQPAARSITILPRVCIPAKAYGSSASERKRRT